MRRGGGGWRRLVRGVAWGVGPVGGLAMGMTACGGADGAGRAGADAGAGGAPLVTVAAEALPPVAPREVYAGSARCAGCHTDQAAAWAGSTHGRAGGVPGSRDNPVRVIAPFGGVPLRFADATVIPRQVGGRYEFLVRRAGERDTAYAVDGVIGGGHMEGGGTQGFVTRWPDGTVRFLPFDWSRHGGTWFCHTGTRRDAGWVPITPTLRLGECGDWPPSRVLGDDPRFSNCQGCHGSQVRLAFDTVARRWSTRVATLAVDCESCHGAGARHVALMRQGGRVAGDIGMASLVGVDKEASVRGCLGCHSLKARLPGRTPGGTDARAHYTLLLSQLGERPYTPDGRTRTFAYQEGHFASDCYRNGGMTCVSCHDPHSQGYRTADGVPIPGRTDDRQCTSCHASKGTAEGVVAHTRHPAGSAGSRCVGCHMPYLQQPELGRAIRYGRSDHTIAIPRPGLDSSLGVETACATCHAGWSTARLEAQVRAWWGGLKPHAPAVAGVLAARGVTGAAEAAPLLLHPGARDPMAQVAGVGEWLARFAVADQGAMPAEAERRLLALAEDPVLEVRAVALATLHYTRGGVPRVRRVLERAARAPDPGGALRRRWALVLGGIGDDAREGGRPQEAVVAYRKALAVLPGEGALLQTLGLALAAGGTVGEAVASYQAALRADPWQPMAAMNLGVALEQQGDVAGAAAAYTQASALDPTLALGHLNLGTLALRNGAVGEAVAAFRRGVALDPGVAVGHFQLALALVQQGALREAQASVRRALALEPGHVEAGKLAEALAEALGGGGGGGGR
jgi:tetratricopeptide (TPR) repeat protein